MSSEASVLVSQTCKRLARGPRSLPALLLCAVSCWLLAPISSASAAGAGALRLEILSSQSVAERPYVFARGALSGRLTRSDGSTGTFKVPLWLVYPRDARRCNGFGVVEPIHPLGGAAFMAQLSDAEEGRQGADWQTLAGGAGLFGRTHGGYVWAGVVWSRDVLGSLVGTEYQGIAIDGTYHIDNEFTDRHIVLQAASLLLRDPAAAIGVTRGQPPPCAAGRVVAGGHSDTAQVLRDFYFARQNTALATDARFRHGAVFDGSLQNGITENACRDLAGRLRACNGPTPAGEGKVITTNTEFDVQFTRRIPGFGYASGRLARGTGPSWRIYEIAGVSHIPTFTFDLAALGIKPPAMADQNPADGRPVYRAMVENLRRWIASGVRPPPNALLEGRVVNLRFRRDFDVLPWFVPFAFVPPSFDRFRDYDLNADGGIRLPHVRTRGFGGPLGLYRGLECANPRPLSDAFACPLVPVVLRDDPGLILLLLGGSFVPYTELAPELAAARLPSPCRSYGSRRAYLAAVARAAIFAADRRWVLRDEIASIVAKAGEQAARHPGCVPPR